MKGLKSLRALRFLIIGGLIFFVGCGQPQNELLVNRLKDEKATVTTAHVSNVTQEKEEINTTKPTEDIPSNVEQKEKILITGGFSNVEWCGTNALIVEGANTIEWIDIWGKKNLKIKEIKRWREDKFLGITSDGKWVVYTDSKSSRLAPWFNSPPIKEERCLNPGEWNGYIVDVYRYEIGSERKEKIGIMRELSMGKISPDGKKIFLGGKVKDDIDMLDIPEPKWEKLYFTEKDWDVGESFIWLQDSSGVVTNESEMGGEGKRLFVELFGIDSWHKVFDTGLGNIYNLQAHKDKTFYFRGAKEEALSKFSLYEAKINENGGLSYKEILKPKEGTIEKYVVLPNTDIVFWKRGDKWVHCVDREQMKEKWVVKIEETQKEGDSTWIGVVQMKVSPDGRWLAFIEGQRSGNFLFIVKLK